MQSVFHTKVKLVSIVSPVVCNQGNHSAVKTTNLFLQCGEMRIQAVSRCTVQCGTITFCHIDVLHDCLSTNSSLDNGEKELRHLFRYCISCKSTLTILLREHAYSTTGKFKIALFDIWLHHPTNCSPVGHGLYTQFTRSFPSFVEVDRACETTLYV